MKDKNLLFSISLTVTLVVLIILSCALTTERFNLISQALGVPLFIFTIISFSFSIREENINHYYNEIKIKTEQLEVQKERKKSFLQALNVLKVISDPNSEHYAKDLENIESFENKIQKSDVASNELNQNISYYEQLIQKTNKNLTIPVLYIVALSLLLFSLVMPEIVATWFVCIKASTLTLISFLFPILEILVKKPLSNIIVNAKMEKYKKRINDSQQN